MKKKEQKQKNIARSIKKNYKKVRVLFNNNNIIEIKIWQMNTEKEKKTK